jgi:hypothetical protein
LDSLSSDDEDISNARSAIYRAVCLRAGNPFSAEAGAVNILPETWAAMTEVFDRLQAETRRLVEMHWPAIQRVAKALTRHDRIDQTELDRLIVIAESTAAPTGPNSATASVLHGWRREMPSYSNHRRRARQSGCGAMRRRI